MYLKPENSLTLAQEAERRAGQNKVKLLLFRVMPLGILVLMIVLFSAVNPRFLRLTNIYNNILDTVAVPLLLVVGITPVILMGCIDLSLEGVTGLSACVLGALIANTKNANNLGVLAIVAALAAGALVGFLQGVIHVRLKLPTFIVTFAVGYICKGVGLLTYMGVPGTITDEAFRGIYYAKLLGLPYTSWIAFAVFLLAVLIEKFTRTGRYIFAIGNNEEIVKMAGVNIGRVKVLVFSWCGLCCGCAGVVASAKLGYSIMSLSSGTLFPALTAVVIGGTLLTGGVGGVFRSFIGVLIVSVINAGMIFAGIASTWQQAVQGAIVLAAVVIASLDSRGKIVK